MPLNENDDFLSVSEDESLFDSESDNENNSSTQNKKKKTFKNAKYCSFENIHGRKCTTRILKKGDNIMTVSPSGELFLECTNGGFC